MKYIKLNGILKLNQQNKHFQIQCYTSDGIKIENIYYINIWNYFFIMKFLMEMQ